MADNEYSFEQARARLDEIVTQVRKKDVSLEKSLDLLEEGVRLANICTELSDHTEWRTVAEQAADSETDAQDEPAEDGNQQPPADGNSDTAVSDMNDEDSERSNVSEESEIVEQDESEGSNGTTPDQ